MHNAQVHGVAGVRSGWPEQGWPLQPKLGDAVTCLEVGFMVCTAAWLTQGQVPGLAMCLARFPYCSGFEGWALALRVLPLL